MPWDDVVYEIVTALAEADGVEPTELDYTLADFVSPGWLEALISMESGPWEFTFQVPGHEVTLTDDGELFVDGVPHRSARTERRDGRNPADRNGGATQSSPWSSLGDLPGMIYQCRNERGWPMDFIGGNCRELTGYDPNAYVVGGVNYGIDVIHPDDRDTVWDSVQRSLRNDEPFSLTYRIETPDGEKWVWEKGMGIFDDGEVVGIVGFVTDVNDHAEDERIPERA